MEVGMVKQVLPPRVKDGKETNFRSKMFGIGGNSQHRVGRGSEENAIDGALVLQGNVGNLFRYGKDDMKILGLEKFRLPVFDPLGAGQRLTFRAVTIRTGVVPEALVAAAVTHFDVTAQGGGAAPLNGSHHAPLRSG